MNVWDCNFADELEYEDNCGRRLEETPQQKFMPSLN